MGVRNLLIATGVLVLLAVGMVISNKSKSAEASKPPEDKTPKIIALADDQFQQVEIKRKDGTDTIIKRTAPSKWEITSPKPYPADADAMAMLVNNLNPLNADRVVADKLEDAAAFGLDAPALEVTITNKDGKARKIFVGNETPSKNVYVRTSEDPRVFTMSGSLKSNLDKTTADFRDKRLLTFDSEKLTRVELTAKKQTVEFGKNNQNEWQILKPQPLRADGWQVEELIRKLKDAKMDLAVSDEDAKKAATSFAGGTVVASAKVTDASGTQQLEVRKVKDDYYGKSSVMDGVHKLPADLGTGLDKGMDDFRNKKLFDFGFSDPTRVEVKNGANAVVYQKSGEKWMAGPKQMDAPSIQSFLDKARDLAATKFPDSGFTAPTFEVAVSWNDGKRSERILISKSGNDYFAKRENESAVYQLDAKPVDDLIKASTEIKEPAPAPAKK